MLNCIMHRSLCVSAGALLGVLCLVRPAAGQGSDWDATRVQMSRPALQDLLQRLDQSALSSAYSPAMRTHAQSEAAAVRARLTDGDFQTGDRITLRVDGEQELTDTFTVGAGRRLTLPVVGTVDLTGVLRSELEPHLQQLIAKYVRNPVVHARSLIRVAVLGEVVHPGFFTLPSETVLTDAVMVAGGPTKDAKVRGVRILRGGAIIWDGKPLQEAMAAGETLDQLNLVAGDQVEVPAQGNGIFSGPAIYALSVFIGLAATIYGLAKTF